MRTIAWNVDTQYDFMSPLGKLYIQDAEKIEPNLERLTQYFRSNGMTIVNTGDCHTKASEELSDTPDFISTFPLHCMRDSKGVGYIPEVRPEKPYVVDWQDKEIDLEKLAGSREVVLYKDKFDIFSGSPHAEKVLETLNPERVVVYGVATNVCVDFAVRGLLERGKEVYVVEDAIQGLPNIPSPINDWKELGAKLIRTDDLYL